MTHIASNSQRVVPKLPSCADPFNARRIGRWFSVLEVQVLFIFLLFLLPVFYNFIFFIFKNFPFIEIFHKFKVLFGIKKMFIIFKNICLYNIFQNFKKCSISKFIHKFKNSFCFKKNLAFLKSRIFK